MGSPQFGRLVLDGDQLTGAGRIETRSLLWSADGTRLAAQELVSSANVPRTRVVVFDTVRRAIVAASPARPGFAVPLRFEHKALIYCHQHAAGERESRLRFGN